jgi:DNA-binding beta-propeller fold protein YncE
MTRFVLFLWCAVILSGAGCGASQQPSPPASTWHVAQRIVLEEGAALHPDDPSKPGEAAPEQLAYINGKVFVADTNLFQFKVAGPSWVSIHDGQTLVREKLLELKTDQVRCTNAGAVRAVGATLYVACAGVISLDATQPSTDGVLVEIDSAQQSLTRAIQVGRSPGAIAKAGNIIWLADLESPTLLRVTLDTGAVADPLPICAKGFASDLIVTGGRAFASCFNDATVQEFDPSTGAQVGSAVGVGDGPIRLAAINGQLAVLNNLAGTVSLIALQTPLVVLPQVVKLGGNQGGSDSEGIDGDSAFAAATNATFGTLVILDVVDAFKLIGSVDLKSAPDAATNSPGGVVMGDDAFYVAVSGWGAPASELIRVAR